VWVLLCVQNICITHNFEFKSKVHTLRHLIPRPLMCVRKISFFFKFSFSVEFRFMYNKSYATHYADNVRKPGQKHSKASFQLIYLFIVGAFSKCLLMVANKRAFYLQSLGTDTIWYYDKRFQRTNTSYLSNHDAHFCVDHNNMVVSFHLKGLRPDNNEYCKFMLG
jgi:hypothetical protein